mmetsp:Transcript_5285/g.10757  ORF Transcript_5285/g.10757 Transcript_5285/m.10757 type:complete len:469 (-) Transcript_5285:7-1413(-)
MSSLPEDDQKPTQSAAASTPAGSRGQPGGAARAPQKLPATRRVRRRGLCGVAAVLPREPSACGAQVRAGMAGGCQRAASRHECTRTQKGSKKPRLKACVGSGEGGEETASSATAPVNVAPSALWGLFGPRNAPSAAAAPVRSHWLRTRKRKHCVEAQLYKLLKSLPSERRRMLIAKKFSESQRLALERWILSEHAKREVGGRQSPGGTGRSQAASSGRLARRSRSASATARQPQSGIRGVHSFLKAGQRWYRASAVAGPFALRTLYSRDLAAILRYQDVLFGICRRVSRCSAGRVEAAFRAAFLEEPRLHGFDSPADLGLRFMAIVPAKYWVGQPLKTPSFTVEGLEVGLSAWRRLSDARKHVYHGKANAYTILRRHSPDELAEAWSQLREVYIDVWAEAGQSSRDVAKRLTVLEDKHRACRQRLLARWQCMKVGVGQAAAVPSAVGLSEKRAEQLADHLLSRWVRQH